MFPVFSSIECGLLWWQELVPTLTLPLCSLRVSVWSGVSNWQSAACVKSPERNPCTLTQQFLLLRIYPKEIIKVCLNSSAELCLRGRRLGTTSVSGGNLIKGSINSKLPPVESSAVLRSGQDGSQVRESCTGYEMKTVLSEKSIKPA